MHGDAHVDSVLSSRFVLVAEHFDANESHNRRNLIAVCFEFLKVLKPGLDQIRFHAFNDLCVVVVWYSEGGGRVAQRREFRRKRIIAHFRPGAPQTLGEQISSLGKLPTFLINRHVFVGNIVTHAAECVGCIDSAPLRSRQSAKSVIEVFRLFARNTLTIIVGYFQL